MKNHEFEELFTGNTIEFERLETAYRGIFTTGARIRHKLGDYAYLVDDFIRRCLNAMLVRDLEEVYANGFDAGGQSLHLEESTHAKISGYKDSRTRNYLTASVEFHRYIRPIVEKYSAEYRFDICTGVDTIELQGLYKDICDRIGGSEDMRDLIQLIKTRFLVPTPMELFWKAANQDLISILGSQDRETSRYMFQLLMDEPDMLESPEK